MAFLKKDSSRKNQSEAKEDAGKKAAGQASPSSVSKSAQTPKAANPFPHEAVMRATYLNPRKLKRSLDSIYGEGKYQVKLQHFKNDLAQLEQRVRSHYND
ncbi:hypothetical protein CTA2_11289 [Colletotrichum tanaceti]|uniref:Uncharacterized protein n=1 Tax=Colletotrichum tanaceti TaxID=1306861 RepID=A0A4U6XE64_9PEZI|nr:hypothetical protein CTA2_11289 [Colletotrichum tanaceti]TKW53764.1 hypothetical protein CTA1_3350 [Colletotrichum tanaceti]